MAERSRGPAHNRRRSNHRHDMFSHHRWRRIHRSHLCERPGGRIHAVTALDNFYLLLRPCRQAPQPGGALAGERFRLGGGGHPRPGGGGGCARRRRGVRRGGPSRGAPGCVLHRGAAAHSRSTKTASAMLELHVVAARSTSLRAQCRRRQQREGPFRARSRWQRPISTYAATKRAGAVASATPITILDGMAAACPALFTVPRGPGSAPRPRDPQIGAADACRRADSDVRRRQHAQGTTLRIDDILQGTNGAIAYTARHPHAFDRQPGREPHHGLRMLIALLCREAGVKPEIRCCCCSRAMWAGHLRAAVAEPRAGALGYAPKTAVEEGVP